MKQALTLSQIEIEEREAEDSSTWPTVLRELAGICGKRKALAIAQTFGGLSNVWIPTTVDSKTLHPWRSVIDDEKQWAAVVAKFGGSRVYVPRGENRGLPRKVRIIEMLEAGADVRTIMRTVGTTERTVRRVAAMVGTPPARAQDSRQQKLFNF